MFQVTEYMVKKARIKKSKGILADSEKKKAKVCELRPKLCVNVNSRGMHWVCVCTYQQNMC